MITSDVYQKSGKKIPSSFWHKWLMVATKVTKLKGDWEISIAVVGDKAMRTLNRQYRGKDYVTDVLSFRDAEIKGNYQGVKKQQLGEIIICYPQIVRQAKQHQQSFSDELALMFVHGFLHLLGYDHVTDKDFIKMEALQEKILKSGK
jgi:probable rRNA maturation factor